MFNRPAFVKPASPLAAIMDAIEAAAVTGNVAVVETHYHRILANIDGMGRGGCNNEDNDLAEYLEQFDSVFA